MTTFRKIKDFFLKSFLLLLTVELVEEIIEEFIAWGVSNLILKAFSTLFVVVATQSLKVLIKTIVKKLTYKEGNDKMDKLKQFFLSIWTNKKTILGDISVTATSVLMAIEGSAVDLLGLPAINIAGFNIMPILFSVVLGIVGLIGVHGKGLESVKNFFARIAAIKQQKEEVDIIKEAKKQLSAEQKQEKLTAEQKAKAESAEARKLAVEQQKAIAKAERDAKVSAAKAELQKPKVENT